MSLPMLAITLGQILHGILKELSFYGSEREWPSYAAAMRGAVVAGSADGLSVYFRLDVKQFRKS